MAKTRGGSGTCLCSLLVFSLVVCSYSPSLGEEKPYPDRPINIIVPYAPGSAPDLTSRLWSDKISEFMGQPLLSVHKPGGGGSLAAAFVGKAKPDGYTVLVGSVSPLVISPIVKKLDYALDDFMILSTISKAPLWLAVKTEARWKTLSDLVTEAKQAPGKFNVATFGKLSAGDFILELLNKYAGIKMVNLPFKGSSEALTALLGGHAQAAIVAGAGGMLEAGTVRILGVAEDNRLEGLSDVPTFKELGYPIVIPGMYCFCFPKGTPQKIVDRFADGQKKATEKYGKEIKATLKKVEQWTDFNTPEETRNKFHEVDRVIRKMAQELKIVAN